MASDFEIVTNAAYYEKKLKWTIKNLSELPLYLGSPPFTPIPGSQTTWILKLDFSQERKVAMSIESEDSTNKFATVELRGKAIFKNPLLPISIEEYFEAIVKLNGTSVFLSMEFDLPFEEYIRDRLQPLKGDVLIFECHMTVITSSDDPNEEGVILERIHKQNVFTDVGFQFGEKTIRAHKAVLSASSPTFAKMFKRDTPEILTNTISMSDVDINVFKCFLEFLYTEKINKNIKRKNIKSNLDSMLKLYEMSHSYEVRNLRKKCANVLINTFLNIKSAVKILKMAKIYNDEFMQHHLFDFFKQKFPDFVITKELSSLSFAKLPPEVTSFMLEHANKEENKTATTNEGGDIVNKEENETENDAKEIVNKEENKTANDAKVIVNKEENKTENDAKEIVKKEENKTENDATEIIKLKESEDRQKELEEKSKEAKSEMKIKELEDRKKELQKNNMELEAKIKKKMLEDRKEAFELTKKNIDALEAESKMKLKELEDRKKELDKKSMELEAKAKIRLKELEEIRKELEKNRMKLEAKRKAEKEKAESEAKKRAEEEAARAAKKKEEEKTASKAKHRVLCYA